MELDAGHPGGGCRGVDAGISPGEPDLSEGGLRRSAVGSVALGMALGTRITSRDVAMLEWIGRHGLVTPQQIGRRFFAQDGEVAQKRAYRRLAKLEELSLIRRDAPFHRHPEVIRLRSAGVTLASAELPPARYVVRGVPHELALVDLVEGLLAQNRGATLETGREIRSRRVEERASGKRRVGRGRIPDAVLTLKGGKTIAVELQLVSKRARDDQTVIDGYSQERFDKVWWYVPEEAVPRVRGMVKAARADDLIEVRPSPEVRVDSGVTDRDVEILRWIGRYGMVTSTQVARRFFSRDGATTRARAASNRLRRLESLRLIQRDIPAARHAAILRLSSSGADVAGGEMRPAGWVPAEISHSLAVVDLMEMLQAEHPGSAVRTEREIRTEHGVRSRGRVLAGGGRIPDGELRLRSGKTVAIELDLSRKRSVELKSIIRSYRRSEYAGVWWFVRPATAVRMDDIVREMAAMKLVEVHPWEGA